MKTLTIIGNKPTLINSVEPIAKALIANAKSVKFGEIFLFHSLPPKTFEFQQKLLYTKIEILISTYFLYHRYLLVTFGYYQPIKEECFWKLVHMRLVSKQRWMLLAVNGNQLFCVIYGTAPCAPAI